MAVPKQVEQLAKGVSPLVRQIISLLLEEIDALPHGQALLPEVQLAEKFGVSRKTVRVAMKRLDDEGIIRRIKRKGTFPTKGACVRPLFRKEVTRLGLVFWSGDFPMGTGCYSLIHAGVVSKAIESECQVVLAGGKDAKETADSCFRLADDKNVDGLILVAFTDQQFLSDISKCGKPVCLLDHYTEAKGIDCIRVDSSKGSELAVEHLHRLGHRKIAYADTHSEATNPARYAGYLQGLKSWGLQKNDSWVFAASSPTNEGSDVAMQLLALPAEERPTAVVAFSDFMAEEMVAVLKRFGFNLPNDLSVVGTGVFSGGAQLGPGITNICFDWARLGRLGVEQLLDRIESPRSTAESIMIAPSLSMGTSTVQIGG